MSEVTKAKIKGVFSLTYFSGQRALALGGIEPGAIPPGSLTTSASIMLGDLTNAVDLHLAWVMPSAVVFEAPQKLLEHRWRMFESRLLPNGENLATRPHTAIPFGIQATFESFIGGDRLADPLLIPIRTALRAINPEEWLTHVDSWVGPGGPMEGNEMTMWDITAHWNGSVWNTKLRR